MTDQEFMKQYCMVEERETMFVTLVNNSDKVTCCSCGYSKERTYGRIVEENLI